MKCSKCGKEIKGTICSYCGEVVFQEEKKEELKSNKELLNYTIFFAALSIILGVFCNFFSQTVILAIIVSIIGCYLSIKYLKSRERKAFIYCLIISIIGFCLSMIVGMGIFTRSIAKMTADDRYSKLLNIELPKKNASTYSVNYGYETKYKVVIYGYDISVDEHDQLSERLSEYIVSNTNDNYFLNLVNLKDEGNNYIYDRDKEVWETPTNTLKYSFVIIRLVQNESGCKLEIYDVAKRNY